jgi:hypothetical protein
MFKKIIIIFISLSLILNTTINATITGTPEVNDNSANIVCEVIEEEEFMPVGDTRGNSVLTKKEVTRACTISKTVQGECKVWQENNETNYLSPSDYKTYESKNFSDSIGSLLAALGAYDQIEHLWSGWKGYCEIGTKSDFSWAEDPMFWASMAVSLIMSGSQEGNFLDNTAVGDTVQSANEALGSTTGGLIDSAMDDTVSSGAVNFASEAADQAVMETTTEIGWEATYDAAYEAATSQFYQNIGSCLMAGGMNIVTSLYEFLQDTESGLDCDPVDEVCDEQQLNEEAEDIITMDSDDFNTLVESFENSDPPENIFDYVTIIKEENGIVSYRMKKLNEIPGVENIDTSAMDEMKEKMKEMKLAISLTMSAISMAGCTMGYGDPDVTQVGGNDSDRADLRMGLSAGINFAAKYMGPYGPVIAALLKVALYVATSYKSIDTCHDEDDAKEAGKRAEQTQKSLKFNLCHHVYTTCAERSLLAGDFLQNDCVLDGYYYCCYDQLMTKILVEQLKAQLGRDWAHCSGITLRDLNYVSFKQCREGQMTDGIHFDGAHQSCGDIPACYDPTQSFQYYYHCIDMTEFLEYLQATIGQDISMEDFEDFWNDMTEQNPDGGATY